MRTNDEFYIGWEAKAPPTIAQTIKTVVAAVGLTSAFLGILLAISQQTIGHAVFEWGKVKDFSGVFRAAPYPHLEIATASGATSNYYLVKAFKFGIDPDLTKRFDGQDVSLKGTLIYRDDQRMIEVVEGSIHSDGSRITLQSKAFALGKQTLVGEIVDSKCYFGVMNPGQFIPHRACAIRCISGGVPPVLVVRQKNGNTSCLLLTSAEGKALRNEILRMIAEPVRVTGFVQRDGNLFSIRAEKIERVHGS